MKLAKGVKEGLEMTRYMLTIQNIGLGDIIIAIAIVGIVFVVLGLAGYYIWLKLHHYDFDAYLEQRGDDDDLGG